jgi:hypothetical protein
MNVGEMEGIAMIAVIAGIARNRPESERQNLPRRHGETSRNTGRVQISAQFSVCGYHRKSAAKVFAFPISCDFGDSGD